MLKFERINDFSGYEMVKNSQKLVSKEIFIVCQVYFYLETRKFNFIEICKQSKNGGKILKLF